MTNNELFQSICDKNNIKFTDISINPFKNWTCKNLEFTFRNKSYTTFDEIVLGLYEDEELRVASFFHELGHIKDKKNHTNKYEQEKSAWKIGFKLAKQYKFKFSRKTINWCGKQLETYNV